MMPSRIEYITFSESKQHVVYKTIESPNQDSLMNICNNLNVTTNRYIQLYFGEFEYALIIHLGKIRGLAIVRAHLVLNQPSTVQTLVESVSLVNLFSPLVRVDFVASNGEEFDMPLNLTVPKSYALHVMWDVINTNTIPTNIKWK